MDWWHSIMNYYKTLGEKYSVDPVIFVSVHIVATPLFAAAVWWLIYNKRKKRSLFLPAIIATLIFNAANIYLVISGKNIQWWIYGILIITTIISSHFTIQKVRKKLRTKK